MSRRLVIAAAFVAASFAQAQAPRITTAGDPSVRADTIYKLAVDPAAYPEETAAYLLDDGVLRIEPDGRSTRTFRQIIQVLRPEAVDRFTEQEFSYAPKHEKFTINWMRVVKPDGSIVSEAPTHVQESDVPAQLGDPTYSDRKVLRVSLTGVAPGTLVDYSITTEELKPFLPGDFFDPWSVSTGLRVKRSRYIVDFPVGFTPVIREQNLNFARKETTGNGRHAFIWATADLPKIKPELFAADSNGIYMSVYISAPTTWGTIGKWYAGNASSRYVTTPAVDAKIAEAVKGARTLDDSIKAVHRWVAQDIRYVSIALGLGGYQPRSPDEVVRTAFGDCKDKATLFVVAMQKLGVSADPVILNSSGHVRRDMPSIAQFDHAIAAFKRPGRSNYEFADLTASLTPLGELPFSYQGEFGVVVHRDGSIEEVTFPKAPATGNRYERRITGTISTDGLFDGRYEEAASGARQYELRRTFENPLDSTQRAKGADAIAAALFDGARGDSLRAFSGKDLAAAPRMSVVVRGGRAASMAGNNAILTNPLGTMAGLSNTARDLESAGPRLFPISADRLVGIMENYSEVRLTLPEGWHAQLPPNVDVQSVFGNYHSHYSQAGRDLLITRTETGASGTFPPDQAKQLAQWLRDIAKDDAKMIVIAK